MNFRKLCKPSTDSWIRVTVSNSPSTPRVSTRLYKHGKSTLLLKYVYIQKLKQGIIVTTQVLCCERNNTQYGATQPDTCTNTLRSDEGLTLETSAL